MLLANSDCASLRQNSKVVDAAEMQPPGGVLLRRKYSHILVTSLVQANDGAYHDVYHRFW